MSSSTKTAKCAVLALFAMLLMLAGVPAANAQGSGSAVKISGKITDSAAGALPGAGIHIKGTTKSGKDEKAKVNFKYTVGVDAKPKSLDMCNAEEYIYLTRSMVNIDPNADEAIKAKFREGSYGMSTGKGGVVYQRRTAICLETQKFPDTPNKPEWPSALLRPGETYTSHCIFEFGIK